jgi:hypothetical protein
MNPLRVIYLASIAVPLLVRILLGSPDNPDAQASRTLYRSVLGFADPLVLLVLLALALGLAVVVSQLERRGLGNLDASRTTVVLLALSGASAVVALGLVGWLSMEQIAASPILPGYTDPTVEAHRHSSGMSNVALLAVVLGIVDTLLASFRVRAAAFQRRVQEASAPDQEPGSSPAPDDAGDPA